MVVTDASSSETAPNSHHPVNNHHIRMVRVLKIVGQMQKLPLKIQLFEGEQPDNPVHWWLKKK